MALGLVVHVFGYAIFVSSDQVVFVGYSNRVAIAAAWGVAMALVGGLGWISSLIRSGHWSHRIFTLGVALVCLSAVLVVNALASFWTESYRQQEAALASIHRHVDLRQAGRTLMLSGICPYLGPAPVFESRWELAGALIVSGANPTLRADVVTREMKIGEEGLTTRDWGEEAFYPYDEQLLLYDLQTQTTQRLINAEVARDYFEVHNPDLSSGCPHGRENIGTPVFPLDQYYVSFMDRFGIHP
jgi:hypothetical protein